MGIIQFILAIGAKFREIHDKPFSFSEVDKEEIFKKSAKFRCI